MHLESVAVFVYVLLSCIATMAAYDNNVAIEEHIIDTNDNNPLYQDLPYENHTEEQSQSSKMNNFVKKLIIVVANEKPVTLDKLFHNHSDMMFLQYEPSFIAQSLGVSESETIQSLYTCHPSFMAYVVDYVNKHLLKSPNRPWCGSHKITKQHIESLGNKVICRPASKSKVENFCRSHHLAVKVGSVDSRDIIQNIQANVKSEHLRIIRFVDTPSEGKRRILGEDGINAGSNKESMTDINLDDTMFVINQGSGFADILELFNYLDIYITDSVLQLIKNQYQIRSSLINIHEAERAK